MKTDEILSFEGENARSLLLDGGELYVGSEWAGDDHEANAVYILDRSTFSVRKKRPMPYLVSDLAIVDGVLYAALGPGELAVISKRGLGKLAAGRIDANAPELVCDATDLFWGTYFGEIHHIERGCIATMRKRLQSIALGPEYVYATYDDGKLRVFRRDDGKRVKLLAVGKRKAACTFGDRLFTANDAGSITRWSSAYEPELTFEHDVSASEYGIIGLDAFGDRLVSRTYEDVCVWDRNGKLVTRWRSKQGDINAAVLDGNALLVAVGSRVLRLV